MVSVEESNYLKMDEIPERLVKLVKVTYQDSEETVRTPYDRTKAFSIMVGLHQGQGLSIFLFVVVIDEVTTRTTMGASLCRRFGTGIRNRSRHAREMAKTGRNA